MHTSLGLLASALAFFAFTPAPACAQGNSANAAGQANSANGQSNGQGNANGQSGATSRAAQSKPSSGNVDTDWNNLRTQATSAQSALPKARSETSDNDRANIKNQADQSRQTAQDAKDFYTRFPTNPKAPEARKLEAIAGLHGIQDGDSAHEQSALAVAKAYCDNKTNSTSDRLEVALSLELVNVSNVGKAKKSVPRTADWEQMADKLRAEYGNQAQLHDYYAQLVRSGDMFAAKRIATNLLSWNPSTKVKIEAQSALDRHALIGRPLNLTATAIDGSLVDLAQLKGNVTVVFVWPAALSPNVLDQLRRFRTAITPGVRVLYLAIGGDQKKTAAAVASQPIPGRSAYIAKANASAASSALKLRESPYLYVVNAQGNLTGFGPVAEMANLLYLAAQP